MKILIVRLGAMGDIIHALPAVAALRARYPEAQIDWLVDARHLEILERVPIVNERIVWRAPGVGGWGGALRTLARLRSGRYDLAIDLQGLLKSAVLARVSGARKVIRVQCSQGASPGRLGRTVSPLDLPVIRRRTQGAKWVLVHSALARKRPVRVRTTSGGRSG